MRIGTVEVGGSAPCRLVAELSNNHNGSLDRAYRLIDAAAEAGADFVKFQCYTPAELVALRGDGPAPDPWGAQGWSMRQLYEKAQTPLAWFPSLATHCGNVGIPWFSSVFGLESLKVLEECGCPAYKIARLDNGDESLFRAVESRGKPTLTSYSGSPSYVRLHEHRLYCPPGYPTAVAEVRLPSEFADRHGWWLGLSSHCLAPELPIAAVARGAKLIEMHMMLAEEPSDLEASVSLTEHQFAAMVRSVRATEEMLG